MLRLKIQLMMCSVRVVNAGDEVTTADRRVTIVADPTATVRADAGPAEYVANTTVTRARLTAVLRQRGHVREDNSCAYVYMFRERERERR